MNEINYQEEIQKLLQIDSIKEYYENRPYMQKMPLYPLYITLSRYYQYSQQQTQETQETQEKQDKERITQRIEERRKRIEEEERRRIEEEERHYQEYLQSIKPIATPEMATPGDAKHTKENANQLLFIHNARQWQLLKERHKNSVLIDKMLVIISHEFLLYERNTIEIKLDKILEYLNITVSKSSIDYIRRKLKSITDFLIEREFIQEMAIKNSVVIIALDTLYTKELETQRIITRIKKNDMTLEDNLYILKRVQSFYINNLKIKFTDIRIESIYAYIQDTNISRKKRKILDHSKKLN